MNERPAARRARDIAVEPGRQRKKFEKIEELAESITRVGLIHPIVVDESGNLIAGERRLRAWIEAYGENSEIPVTYMDLLEPYQRLEVELEENIRRQNLTWQEESLAVLEYFELRKATEEGEYTQDDCGDSLGFSRTYVAARLGVAEALRAGHKQVTGASMFSAALSALKRERSRGIDTEMEALVHAMSRGEPIPTTDEEDEDELEIDLEGFGSDDEEPTLGEARASVSTETRESKVERNYRPASKDITVEDFNKFARDYSGDRFNFVHCDFPYGLDHDRSDQASSGAWDTYEDSEEIFFTLLHSLLQNHRRILATNSHVMLWFSMNHYRIITEILDKLDEFSYDPYPLIWYKSDKRGILPDPKRGPRRVYETALLIRKGDRPVARPLFNVAAWELAKHRAEHYSQKPAGMLSQFFMMLVDESTVMLDPTCGAGTALAVATAKGARAVRGMDINKEHVETAIRAVNAQRLHGVSMEPEEHHEW